MTDGNEFNQCSTPLVSSASLVNNDILNEDFFNLFRSTKKINDKKKKISELIKIISSDPYFIFYPEIQPKLPSLYEIILLNLIENNNAFVISQLDLIQLLGAQLNSDSNFKKFFKSALPKIFDKIYLQNDKIDEKLSELFNKSIQSGAVSLNDFYSLIENVLEENDEYRKNILTFLSEQVNKNPLVNFGNFSKNLLDLLTKLSNDNDSQVSNASFKIIEILTERGDGRTSKGVSPLQNYQQNENDGGDDIVEMANQLLTSLPTTSVASSSGDKSDKNINGINNINNINNGGDGKNFLIEDKKIKKQPLTNAKNENNKGRIKRPKKGETNNLKEKNNEVQNNGNNGKEQKITNGNNTENNNINNNNINNNNINNNNGSKMNNNISEFKSLDENNVLFSGTGPNGIVLELETLQIVEKLNKNVGVEKNSMEIYSKATTINRDSQRPSLSSIPTGYCVSNNSNNNNVPKSLPQKPKENNIETGSNIYTLTERPISVPKKNDKMNFELNNLNVNMDEINDILDINKIDINQLKKEENKIINNTEKNDINENIVTESNVSDGMYFIQPSTDNFKKDLDKNIDLLLEKEKKEQEEKNIKNKKNAQSKSDEKDEENTKKEKKEDPKFDTIKSILGKEITSMLDDPKWNIKKQAYELISDKLTKGSIPVDSYTISDLYNYLKFKLKNFKETNFNLHREALGIFMYLIKNNLLSKEHILNLILSYYEKISDMKLKDNIISLITSAFDIIEPSTILKQLISKLQEVKNVKILNEFAVYFFTLVDDLDINELPMREIIDYATYLANNSNPQARTNATVLLCNIYKYYGSEMTPLLKNIKESTMKNIQIELDKVTVIGIKNKKSKKEKKNDGKKTGVGNKNDKNETESKKIINNELIQPVSIAKKLTPSLIKNLSDGKWVEKREAFETIEKILTDANMKILPDGLDSLFDVIKNKLNDCNKNFVKLLIGLLNKLILALREDFKQFGKHVALKLIPNLADKNNMIRKECIQCFEQWVQYAGIESLAVYFPIFLKNENTDIRIEILNFFKKFDKELYKNKFIGETVYQELIEGLLICLQDRTNNVRTKAEEIIKLSLKYIPIDAYFKKIEDFKPTIANDLRIVLEQIEKNYTPPFEEENFEEEEETDFHEKKTGRIGMNRDKSVDNHKRVNHPRVNNSTLKTRSIKLNYTKNNKENLINSGSAIKQVNSSKEVVLDEDKIRIKTNKNKSKKKQEKNYIESDTDDECHYNNTKNKQKNTSKNNNRYEKSVDKVKNEKYHSISRTAEKKKNQKKSGKLIEKDYTDDFSDVEISKFNPPNSKGALVSNSTVLRNNKKLSSNISNGGKKTKKINSNSNLNSTWVEIFARDMVPPLSKSKRYENDKKNKVFMENFYISNTNNGGYGKYEIMKMKELSRNLFSEIFQKKIFDNDISKLCEALKDLKNYLESGNFIILFDNIDIILKILFLKLDSKQNPMLTKSIYDFFASLYSKVFEDEYKLSDIEINLILNILLDKLITNSSELKKNIVLLIIKYIEFDDSTKATLDILSSCLHRNSKMVENVLDLVQELAEDGKITLEKKSIVKSLGKYLEIYANNNNNEIRKKIMCLFKEIYDILRDELWNCKEIDSQTKNYLREHLLEFDYDDNDEKEEVEEEEEDNNEEENEENEEEENDENNENYEEEENEENNCFFKEFNNNNKNNNNNNKFNKEQEKKVLINNASVPGKSTQFIKKVSKPNNNNNTNNYNTNQISSIISSKSSKINNEYSTNNPCNSKRIVVQPKKKLQSNNQIKKPQLNPKSNLQNKSSILNSKNSLNLNNTNYQKAPPSSQNKPPTNSNVNSANKLNRSIEINNDANDTYKPEGKLSNEKELLDIMYNLLTKDETERLNTIIIVHEILCSKYQENKYILIPNVDNIIRIFIQLTHIIFQEENLEEIPLKFSKYLATILCKLTSNKELIMHLGYKTLYDLCTELLSYLLIQNLEKIGDNQESNIIFKSLNSAMLRVIENCDNTSVILVLLELIKQNQFEPENQNLSNLAVRCLIKTTGNLSEIINHIQIEKIFLQMHLVLVNYEKIFNGIENVKSQTDSMIIRYIKNFVIDVTKLKKEKILEDYNKAIKGHPNEDKFILSRINNTLENIGVLSLHKESYMENPIETEKLREKSEIQAPLNKGSSVLNSISIKKTNNNNKSNVRYSNVGNSKKIGENKFASQRGGMKSVKSPFSGDRTSSSIGNIKQIKNRINELKQKSIELKRKKK